MERNFSSFFSVKQENVGGESDDTIVRESPTASLSRNSSRIPGDVRRPFSVTEDDAAMAPLPFSPSKPPSAFPSQGSQAARAKPGPLSFKKRMAKALEERGTPNSSEKDPSAKEGKTPETGASPGNLPVVTLNEDATHVRVVLDSLFLRPKAVAKRKRGDFPSHGD